MPYGPDKIIINGNGSRGMAGAIQAEFDSLKHLGAEIVENGWEAETASMRDDMQVACDKHHDADMEYYNSLRKMVKRMAKFIDDKIAQQPKPKP